MPATSHIYLDAEVMADEQCDVIDRVARRDGVCLVVASSSTSGRARGSHRTQPLLRSAIQRARVEAEDGGRNSGSEHQRRRARRLVIVTGGAVVGVSSALFALFHGAEGFALVDRDLERAWRLRPVGMTRTFGSLDRRWLLRSRASARSRGGWIREYPIADVMRRRPRVVPDRRSGAAGAQCEQGRAHARQPRSAVEADGRRRLHRSSVPGCPRTVALGRIQLLLPGAPVRAFSGVCSP